MIWNDEMTTCSTCGDLVEVREGKIATHNYPPPTRQVCPGSSRLSTGIAICVCGKRLEVSGLSNVNLPESAYHSGYVIGEGVVAWHDQDVEPHAPAISHWTDE